MSDEAFLWIFGVLLALQAVLAFAIHKLSQIARAMLDEAKDTLAKSQELDRRTYRMLVASGLLSGPREG